MQDLCVFDIEAEERILAEMMRDDEACIEAMTMMRENDFIQPTNQAVFSVICDLVRQGVSPTSIEVTKEGTREGLITDGAEVQRIAEMQLIRQENMGYWVAKAKLASKARKADKLLEKVSNELASPFADVDAIVRGLSSDSMALELDTETDPVMSGIQMAEFSYEQVDMRVTRWRSMQEEMKATGRVPLEGVATGLPRLDRLTLGYKPGDLIILGAETGNGKTAMALNTALAACIQGGAPTLYINTEMSKQQMSLRWLTILSGVESQRIRNGSLTDVEAQRVKDSIRIMEGSPYFVAEMPNLTIQKCQTLTRKYKLGQNIQLLILDYIGRMDTSDPKAQEWLVLSHIIKTVKTLAQNLELAAFVLVQLNKDGQLQASKRMKNEADLMLKLLPLCENMESVAQRKTEQAKFEAKVGRRYEDFNYLLFVDKSRDSESGISIPLIFDKTIQRFREAKLIEGGA